MKLGSYFPIRNYKVKQLLCYAACILVMASFISGAIIWMALVKGLILIVMLILMLHEHQRPFKSFNWNWCLITVVMTFNPVISLATYSPNLLAIGKLFSIAAIGFYYLRVVKSKII